MHPMRIKSPEGPEPFSLQTLTLTVHSAQAQLLVTIVLESGSCAHFLFRIWISN